MATMVESKEDDAANLRTDVRSSQYSLLTFVTVAGHTSKAATSSEVLHPSADLRRRRAGEGAGIGFAPMHKGLQGSTIFIGQGHGWLSGHSYPPFWLSIPPP